MPLQIVDDRELPRLREKFVCRTGNSNGSRIAPGPASTRSRAGRPVSLIWMMLRMSCRSSGCASCGDAFEDLADVEHIGQGVKQAVEQGETARVVRHTDQSRTG